MHKASCCWNFFIKWWNKLLLIIYHKYRVLQAIIIIIWWFKCQPATDAIILQISTLWLVDLNIYNNKYIYSHNNSIFVMTTNLQLPSVNIERKSKENLIIFIKKNCWLILLQIDVDYLLMQTHMFWCSLMKLMSHEICMSYHFYPHVINNMNAMALVNLLFFFFFLLTVLIVFFKECSF